MLTFMSSCLDVHGGPPAAKKNFGFLSLGILASQTKSDLGELGVVLFQETQQQKPQKIIIIFKRP